MQVLESLLTEILVFFRYPKLLKPFEDKGLEALYTFEGIMAILSFLIPMLLIYEIVRSQFVLKKGMKDFKMPLLIYIANRLIGKVISIAMFAWCVSVFKPFAILNTSPLTWYWFIYSYVVYEFGHFLYHYWGHKVRLFWCLHGQHHAPEDMNLTVNFAHFFLEGPYATFIRATTCLLFGVEPAVFLMILTIDGFWGEIIHFSEDTLRDGRLGWVGRVLLTPSHHRVHHSRNPLYMDTNFCNLLPIWDRVFGTYQDELPHEKPEYGVTRPIKPDSFVDFYFGELTSLAQDVWRAPGLLNKIKYVVMPPGWSHTGVHQLARDKRQMALQNLSVQTKTATRL
jgi:sterol desaturase/sphingolipid hydroxylase (fatty acid hydroxylase superfamily)